MKQKILSILIANKGTYVSGQRIANELSISREAVSKHIQSLRDTGYHIESKTNKGYCLDVNTDILDSKCIQQDLHPFYQVRILDSVNSTNDWMKERIHQLDAGSVVIANQQTNGRGRKNRSFYSPGQNGIYLSLLLKPHLPYEQLLKITACTSVALYDAIFKNYGIQSQIKWVNDVLIDYKKIAGILCEATIEFGQPYIDSLVIGVGINMHSYTFPKELQEIAGCIEDFTDIKVCRNTLIRDFLNAFYSYYQDIHTHSFLETYRQASCILGQMIQVHQGKETYEAKAVAINDNGYLIIEKNGKEYELSSGEITIRRKF